MRHVLKEHVTNSMLIACGFRIVVDPDILAIKTLETRSVFVDTTKEVVVWDKKDIQDLIELGYVEELK